MVTAVVMLILFALFAIACLVGFFVGLYFFVLSIRLDRERIAPLGPIWAFWRAWSYAPSNLTLEGQRILPKWRKAMVVFFACLAMAPLSASLALMLAGKADPLFGMNTPFIRFQVYPPPPCLDFVHPRLGGG